jgi:solute carrier family 10 (sodium/bile acid cotransporter), member 7
MVSRASWEKLRSDYGFVGLLVVLIGLAWVFPEPAARGGILRSEVTTKLGVAVIFLLQGLVLPTNQLAGGARPWRLHAFNLSWNYLWFPVVTLGLVAVAGLVLPSEILVGFGFLAILPTTISSAISLTVAAGGSSPSAMVSCVASNLLAVVLVPLLAVALLQSSGSAEVPLGPMLGSLSLMILAPVAVGQGLRQLVPGLVTAAKPFAKPVSSGIILFMVHVAFANSVQSGFWKTQSVGIVVEVLVVTGVLLGLVSAAVWVTSGWLRIPLASRRAAFFCSSQKSLATGLPLATSIFAAVPTEVPLGVILLPLLCYHPAQLVLGAALAGRWSGRPPEALPAR